MASGTNRSRPAKSVVLRLLFATIVLIVGLTALLPSLLSTSWGQAQLIAYLNRNINGKLSVERIRFGWFTHQTVQGLKLYDQEGNLVVSLDRFSSDLSPLRLLSRRPNLGQSEVLGLQVSLIEEPNGQTSLQTILDNNHKSNKAGDAQLSSLVSPITLQIPFKGSFTLKDGSITWSGTRVQSLALKNVAARIDIPSSKGPVTARLAGVSQQGDLQGEFSLDATLSGFDANHQIVLRLDKDGVLLPDGNGKITLNVKVHNLAVDVLDRLASMRRPDLKGTLLAALGDRLNFALSQEMTHENAIINLSGESPNLQADFATQVQDGKVTLQKPGTVTLKVTPQLFAHLAPVGSDGAPLLTLTNDTTLQVVFDRLTVPSGQTAGLPEQPTLRLHVAFNGADISLGPSVGSVRVEKCEGFLERLEASQSYLVHLDAETSYNGEMGSLQLHGKWADTPDEAKADSPWKGFKGDLAITAEKLPTALVDALAGAQGVLIDVVGRSLDLAANVRADGSQALAQIQVGSEHVTIPSMQLNIGQTITLEKPAQLQTQLSPSLLKRFSSPTSTLSIKDPVPLLVTLKTLNIPIAGSEKFKTLSLDLEVAAAPLLLDGVTGANQGKLRVSNAKLNVKASSLEQATYSLTANIAPDGVTPQLKAFFGTVSALQLAGRVQSERRSAIVTHTVDASFHNELLDAAIKGRITPDYDFVLTSASKVRYRLLPETLAGLTGTGGDATRLLQPADISVTIDRLRLPLIQSATNAAVIAGTMMTPALVLGDAAGKPLAGLSDINMGWGFDGTKQDFSLKLTGDTQIGADGLQSGTLDVHATVSGWAPGGNFDLSAAKVEAKGNLIHLPLAVAGILSGHPELTALFGETLDVRFEGDLAPNGSFQTGNLDLSFVGEGIEGGVALTLSDQLRLKQDSDGFRLEWKLTPTRFAKLEQLLFTPDRQQKLSWQLADSTKLLMRVTDFALPWKRLNPDAANLGVSALLAKLAAKVDIFLNGLVLTDVATHETAVYDTVSLHLGTGALGEKVAFQLSAKEATGTGKEVTSVFTAQGTVENALANGVWMDTSQLAINLEANANHVPLGLLLENPLLGQQFATNLPLIFGKRVDGTAKIALKNLQGTIASSLKGDNGSFSLQGQVRDEKLILTQPLSLSFKLNPELAKTVFGEIMPILSTALSSDQPVALTIEPANTMIPLKDFSPSRVQVSKASVSLGRVRFRNEGQLASVVSLLNILKAGSSDTFSVWLTPVYLSITNGVVKIERMDALIADHYPIAVWGRVDLVKNKVNMVIGLTAQALKAAYGIGNLDDNYILQLALRGSTANASIDKAQAATRITSLVAQSTGGAHGAIIGGVLDLIGGNGEGKVPPPTTDPLPWGSPKATGEKKTDDKAKTTVDKLERELQKGADKILDFLR